MSQYATAADLQDTGLPPGVLEDIPDLTPFIVRASGHVDSYLRGRYALPLASPYPAEVIQAVVAIACYNILYYRGFDSESQDRLIVDRFEYYTGKPGQKGWLDKLSTGQVNLDIAADASAGVHEGGPIVSSRVAPTVTSCRSGRGWNNGGFI